MNTPPIPPVLYPLTLRDAIRDDVKRTFLNVHEFAEEIEIEGVSTMAICDFDAQPGGENLYGNPEDMWAVNAVHAEIVLSDDVLVTPEPHQELIINDVAWLVRFASEQAGLLTLKLYRNVS